MLKRASALLPALCLAFALVVAGCQADYQPRGAEGEPCRGDGDCEGSLLCVSFVCSDGTGGYTTDPRDAGASPDAPPGSDTGTPPRPDTGPPRPDTDTPPDTGGPPPDAGPDAPLPDGQVCQPRERLCRDEATELLCRPDGSGFLFRACGPGQLCQLDRCVDVGQCAPGQSRCVANEFQTCSRDGARWDTQAVCRPGEGCDPEQGGCFPIDGELPNLTFLFFGFGDGRYSPGESFPIFGELANTGSAPAGDFTCSVWLSQDPRLDPERDFLVLDSPFLGLGPGESLPFEVEARIPFNVPPGSYVVIAECDVLDNRIAESNESDNLARPPNLLMVEGDGPQCIEDPFETDEDAPFLPEGEYLLGLCDDEDTFLIRVDQGSELVALYLDTLSFNNALEYTLSNPEFAISGIIEGESFELFPLPPGDYLLRLLRLTPEPFNYALSYSVDGGQGLADLEYEFAFLEADFFVEPGTWVFAEEFIFNSGQDWAPPFSSGIFLSRDERWDPGRDFLLHTTFWPELPPGEGFPTPSEVFIPENTPAGQWFVLFVADWERQVPESNESNNVWFAQEIVIDEGGRLECEDDLDPNSLFDPTRLEEGFYGDLVACPQPEADYFEFCLGDRERLRIDLFFEHDRGDIDINIYDENRNIITSAYDVVDQETIVVDSGSRPACFVAEVYVCCSDRSNAYSMEAGISPLPPDQVCIETFEPNDNFDEATPLEEALNGAQPLALCPEFDVDVYAISLAARDRITVEALSLNRAELQMTAYDPNGQFLNDAFGPNPTIRLRARRDGEYFIELRSFEGRRSTPYELFLAIQD